MKRFLHWRNILSFLWDLFFIPGVVFVAVTAITSFFDQLMWINNLLKTSLMLLSLFFISLIFAVIKNWPKNKFEYKLGNKDTRIGLVIDDYFKQHGSFIVSVNDEFDIGLGGTTLKSKSIKSQVIFNFFDGKCEDLAAKVKKQLSRNLYKHQKNGVKYKMGTTVCIEKDTNKFYLTVNSIKNKNQRVEARKEDFDMVLAELWTFLANHGSKGDIIIPLLGTGNGRISLERRDVFKEIVRSFIASCSEKTYCDKLVIVVNPKDVDSCELDIDDMNEFLKSQCKYQ